MKNYHGKNNLTKSYLHELQNSEAILLIYLADELPAQDRLEVEQMLASDAGLRAELESLRHTMETGAGAMQELDRTTPLPISQSLAARQVVRMINQRKLQARRTPVRVVEVRRFPWWFYAASTAAAAVFALVFWTAYHPSTLAFDPIDKSESRETTDPNVETLARSFDLSTANDSDNQSLVALGNVGDDTGFPDPSRVDDSKSE